MVKRGIVSGLVALLASGCGEMSAAPAPLDVKLAQKPTQTYRLDVAFKDAPGPIAKVRALALYRADNTPCARPQPLSGAVLAPEHRLLLPLEKIDGQRFRAVFHRDALMDEDYFGIGVCRWRLQNIAVHFSSPTTDFTAGLAGPAANVARIQTEQYFLNRDYAEKPEPMTIVYGEAAGFYRRTMGPQFQVRLSAERPAP